MPEARHSDKFVSSGRLAGVGRVDQLGDVPQHDVPKPRRASAPVRRGLPQPVELALFDSPARNAVWAQCHWWGSELHLRETNG